MDVMELILVIELALLLTVRGLRVDKLMRVSVLSALCQCGDSQFVLHVVVTIFKRGGGYTDDMVR